MDYLRIMIWGSVTKSSYGAGIGSGKASWISRASAALRRANYTAIRLIVQCFDGTSHVCSSGV
jgi:hypothetical protein